MATPPEIQESRNVNNAQIALAAGGVLLLLVVVWFLFLRGGEDPVLESAPAPPPVEGEPLIPVDPGDGDGPGNGKGTVETFEVFAPKDPFKPLIDPEANAGTGDPAPTDGIDADGDGQID
ncbi:MAG TPA: hypothetical protein VEU29_07390, partial [Actinomycetota bacterium]|nr:hypothetical protein [Actinomycetota bacterium]